MKNEKCLLIHPNVHAHLKISSSVPSSWLGDYIIQNTPSVTYIITSVTAVKCFPTVDLNGYIS